MRADEESFVRALRPPSTPSSDLDFVDFGSKHSLGGTNRSPPNARILSREVPQVKRGRGPSSEYLLVSIPAAVLATTSFQRLSVL